MAIIYQCKFTSI